MSPLQLQEKNHGNSGTPFVFPASMMKQPKPMQTDIPNRVAPHIMFDSCSHLSNCRALGFRLVELAFGMARGKPQRSFSCLSSSTSQQMIDLRTIHDMFQSSRQVGLGVCQPSVGLLEARQGVGGHSKNGGIPLVNLGKENGKEGWKLTCLLELLAFLRELLPLSDSLALFLVETAPQVLLVRRHDQPTGRRGLVWAW